MKLLTWPFAVGMLLLASPALADPCDAIPDRGPMPSDLRPGAVFRGPVVYVGDADSLCVGVGPRGIGWVEVRLADFYGPELQEPGGRAAKASLERIAMGRTVVCTAGHRGYDRVVARCTLQAVSLGDRMRAAGVAEGGRGSDR
jgi:micrococcal nuclease